MYFVKAALFILLSVLFTSCENDLSKVKLYAKAENSPVETAKNIKIIYSDSARVQVEVKAPQMERYESENPYFEMNKGLTATFFDDELKVKSRMDADYGIRYEREQKMEAKKNVIVVNEKGEQLNTEHLVWDERKEKLTSDEFVKITTKDEVIYGNGFEANQDFSKYKIFNVKGTFPINNSKHDKDS
ncbi:MAG TPA: LPS export ABC transporter periplasmic protein LptC [Bacteroidia bacterium]|nr:LPS export ABC transporter periplasmic protein LptC [Bacteroidia bacterium]HNS11784.1 LPS export ABC transporter periplasmic protein LptC [Bacteroidia bacterium]